MYEITRGPSAVGYEYKSITVPREMESLYTDSFSNFGWEFTGTEPAVQGEIAIVLKFKRDRCLKNRMELNRLEKQFESALHEIQKLERKKHASVMGPALGLGIVGTAFLVGAILSFIAGSTLLGFILLIPSIAGWTLGYFSNIRLQTKKSAQVAPQIDKRYDEIYATCEKAHNLLAQWQS